MRLSASNKRITKIAVLLIGVLLCCMANATTSRGIIETCLFDDSLDFSIINDSCSKRPSSAGSCTFNSCKVANADIRFTTKIAYGYYGILDLGFHADTGYLDTLKNVPASGYSDSVEFSYLSMHHAYAIKTSEKCYAVIHFLFSGSGLPFNVFKWARQTDGTPVFIADTTKHSAAHEEVHSGFWTLIEPSSDKRASVVDFSILTDLCATPSGISGCQPVVEDCRFDYETIVATNGVFYDSAISAQIQDRFIKGKTIGSDEEGRFYLDSMMVLYKLTAPQKEYVHSLNARNGVYFIKTSENRFAVLIKTGQYIGGIDRTYYYWAYQPDSSNVLYKSNLVEKRPSLSIAQFFSAYQSYRNFTITDSAAINAIGHQMYLSVNTLLDSTIKRTDSASCPAKPEYGIMKVAGIFFGDNPISSYMPTLDICSGFITYNKVTINSVIPIKQFMYDKNSRLQKLIINVCCNLNLSVTSQNGTVQWFCDAIPDSLKPAVSIFQNYQQQTAKVTNVVFKASQKSIQYQIINAGRVRLELFDLSGKSLKKIVDRVQNAGIYHLELSLKQLAQGTCVLRLSQPSMEDRAIVIPVTQ